MCGIYVCVDIFALVGVRACAGALSGVRGVKIVIGSFPKLLFTLFKGHSFKPGACQQG